MIGQEPSGRKKDTVFPKGNARVNSPRKDVVLLKTGRKRRTDSGVQRGEHDNQKKKINISSGARTGGGGQNHPKWSKS